jgi:hypothetical protein
LVAAPPCSSNTVTRVASQTARQYLRYLVQASLAIATTRLRPALFCLPTYSFFGVENGQDCWCGNSINSKAQTLPDSSCNTNCTEPDGSVCGSSSAIEIYGVNTSFAISSTSTSTSTSSTIQSSSSSSTTTTQSSSPSTSSLPSSTPTSPTYYSWGCYTEATNIRALSEATLVNYTSIAIEICANFCLVQQGQQLFGVEYGCECYCSEALKAGSVSTVFSDFNMPCDGNASELCGAGNRLNVYGLSKPSTLQLLQLLSLQVIRIKAVIPKRQTQGL